MKCLILPAILFSFLALGVKPNLTQAQQAKRWRHVSDSCHATTTATMTPSSTYCNPSLDSRLRIATIPPAIISANSKPIDEHSARELRSAQLASITVKAITTKMEEPFESLKMGKKTYLTLNIKELSAPSLEGHLRVLVTVEYEARPIGGILRINACIFGGFNGICSAEHPLLSNSWVESVDSIYVNELGTLITNLVHKLGTKYASKDFVAAIIPQR